jgi:hypothetical protein
MAINKQKMNDFMGRFVGDLGAVMHAATVVVGDQLGLYKGLASGPRAWRNWPAEPAPISANSANGCQRRQRVDTSNTTPRRKCSALAKSRLSHCPRKAARHLSRAQHSTSTKGGPNNEAATICRHPGCLRACA